MRGSTSVRFLVLFAVFLLIGPFVFADEPETVTLEVVGEACIYGQDVVTAKEAALESAFRIAVRKAVGTWVTAESFTRNFTSIEDSILTKSRGYIKTYETIEIKVTGDIVTLSVRVTVSLSPLQANLESLLGAMDNPRFVVLSDNDFVKEVVEETLKERGFDVTFCSQEWWTGAIPEPIVMGSSSYLADVLVLAEVGAEYSMFVLPGKSPTVLKPGDLWGCIATLSASSFWLNTAQRIADSSAFSSGSGVSKQAAFEQATAKASPLLVDALAEKITEAWSDLLLNGQPIEIAVTNISYGELMGLRQRMMKLYGVRDIIQRQFEGEQALLETYFTGSAQALADLISMTDFGNLAVQIVAVKRGQVILNLMPK